MKTGFDLEGGRQERELLPSRPVLRAVGRAWQPPGSYDSLPPVGVVPTQPEFPFLPAGTSTAVGSFCPPTDASSVGYLSRGPPRAGAKHNLAERT
jgi:hypothetical protein